MAEMRTDVERRPQDRYSPSAAVADSKMVEALALAAARRRSTAPAVLAESEPCPSSASRLRLPADGRHSTCQAHVRKAALPRVAPADAPPASRPRVVERPASALEGPQQAEASVAPRLERRQEPRMQQRPPPHQEL